MVALILPRPMAVARQHTADVIQENTIAVHRHVESSDLAW